MPKQLDYPKDSLSKSLQLADAVDDLGGSCTVDMCAANMNRAAGSGAFQSLVSAAGKYGLVEASKGKITTTDRYRTFKHAYSAEEKQELLRAAFLDIPVFSQLLDRFHGKQVPEAILSKLLIREFDVSERDANRVASFFLDGLSMIGATNGEPQPLAGNGSSVEELPRATPSTPIDSLIATTDSQELYVISIVGPGLRHEIKLQEPEDLLIVDAILKKYARNSRNVKVTASRESDHGNGARSKLSPGNQVCWRLQVQTEASGFYHIVSHGRTIATNVCDDRFVGKEVCLEFYR